MTKGGNPCGFIVLLRKPKYPHDAFIRFLSTD
jgi:hypothetical protein